MDLLTYLLTYRISPESPEFYRRYYRKIGFFFSGHTAYSKWSNRDNSAADFPNLLKLGRTVNLYVIRDCSERLTGPIFYDDAKTTAISVPSVLVSLLVNVIAFFSPRTNCYTPRKCIIC